MDDLSETLQRSAPPPSRPLDIGSIGGRARRRTRRRQAMVGGAVVLVAAIAIGVVSIIGGNDARETLDVVDEPDPLAGVAPDSLVRLLARVPDAAMVEAAPIWMVDLGRARDQAGVEPLTPDAVDADLADHFESILGASSLVSLAPGEGQPTSAELRAELGFGLDQLDQVVTAGPAPRNLYIAVGRFDPVAIRAAVEGDPARGSRFEIETYRGVEYYRWGGDYAIEGEPTPVRPLGRGGRLVVGDGWLAWTYGDEEVEAIIDTSLDPTASLASVDWLRDTAEVADEHGLTRIVTWPTPTGDGFVTQPAPNQALPLIDAPLGWSGGVDHAPEGAITQYVLVYPTDTDADANLDAFEATWTWFDPPQGVQVAREGPALVATVEWAPGETDFEFEIEIDSEDFGRLAVIPENFYALFNVRTDQPARPELPDPRPNQSEILADGDVTDTEYEIAFWTYVECAEADGATFATITREESGRYAYSISAGSGAADACYQDLFMQVDSTWQIANE